VLGVAKEKNAAILIRGLFERLRRDRHFKGSWHFTSRRA